MDWKDDDDDDDENDDDDDDFKSTLCLTNLLKSHQIIQQVNRARQKYGFIAK